MALHETDISSYQSDMNVKNMTANFVIIKATGGIGYVAIDTFNKQNSPES
ncbi:hypothetical protein LQF67_01610 [Tetragenococcus halophilus]|nr:hypothetical protein [Tetragenococcus halophilus]MCF1684274.1 hypothetical protein [Tetragenococcus halophilus]